MSPAILIAIVAAVPGAAAAILQWRSRHVNPLENGTDWVVSRFQEIAKTEAAASLRWQQRARQLESAMVAAGVAVPPEPTIDLPDAG